MFLNWSEEMKARRTKNKDKTSWKMLPYWEKKSDILKGKT